MRLSRHVENEDIWQRYVEVETQRHQDTGAPRALAKVQVKVQAKEGKGKKRTPETCLCGGKEGHKTTDCTFCGEGEDGSSVHTLLSGVVQVCHELLVDEEEEEEQGRQEEKEEKGEGQSEETAHVNMDMQMGTIGENLSHGACVWMKSR